MVLALWNAYAMKAWQGSAGMPTHYAHRTDFYQNPMRLRSEDSVSQQLFSLLDRPAPNADNPKNLQSFDDQMTVDIYKLINNNYGLLNSIRINYYKKQ